ncbi:MAG: hypothetical protein H6773_02010 [Pseudomonadales bacterium]|nr:hypothetical protein [Pseudomonadales bacterium]
MPNEISDYIATQIEAGYTNDQIEAALKKSGWSEIDILSALKDLQGPPEDPPGKPNVPTYVGSVVVGLLVFATSAVAVWYFSNPSRGTVSVSLQEAENPPDFQMQGIGEEALKARKSADSMEVDDGEMDAFAVTQSTSSAQYQVSVVINELSDLAKVTPYLVENLPGCKPVTISYGQDPSNFDYAKKILGWIDETCHYIEEMPNGYATECYLPKNKLQPLVDEITSTENGSSIFSMSDLPGTEGAEVETNSLWATTFNDAKMCTTLVNGRAIETGNIYCAEGVTCTE